MHLSQHSSATSHRSCKLSSSCAQPIRVVVAPRRSASSRIAAGGLFGGLFGGSGDAKQQPNQPPRKQADVDAFMVSSPNTKPVFPPMTTVSKGPVYDLRFYDVYPVVEMEYTRREEGYAALGGYIDGDNLKQTRFPYSQPVVMRYEPSGQKVMSMFLGAPLAADSSADGTSRSSGASIADTLRSLPAPNDSAVRVSVGGGELVAVYRWEGFITPETAAQAQKLLLAALKKDGLVPAEEESAGLFRVGQYGAVYSIGERMNEMFLRVQPPKQ